MKKNNFQTKSGFTIIETLVAITILIIGVLGPLALAARGISDGLFAQNQLTANVLAQEAIETMVNRRNGNIVSNLYAFTDLVLPGQGIGDDNKNSSISIDGADGTINLSDSDCSGAGGCKLFIDPTNGFYKNSTDGTGLFSRKITVTLINADEVKVDVLISWKNKTVDKYLSTTIYLYGM